MKLERMQDLNFIDCYKMLIFFTLLRIHLARIDTEHYYSSSFNFVSNLLLRAGGNSKSSHIEIIIERMIQYIEKFDYNSVTVIDGIWLLQRRPIFYLICYAINNRPAHRVKMMIVTLWACVHYHFVFIDST